MRSTGRAGSTRPQASDAAAPGPTSTKPNPGRLTRRTVMASAAGAVVGACMETGMASDSTSKSLKIAVCQILCIDGDRAGNFRRIEYALEDARKGGAVIACFPESAILGWENPDAHKLATPIPGGDAERIGDLARRFNMMIAIGLDEKAGDKLYDSAILVDRTGKLLLRHRKLNVLAELMDPPYSEGTVDGISAVDTEFGRIGVLICADTFVGENIDRMRDLKPDLVLVPYGWAAEVDRWPDHAKLLHKLVSSLGKHWSCPVVGTDLVGAISQGPWRNRTYGGASVVVDGKGKEIAILRDRDVETRVVEVVLSHE